MLIKMCISLLYWSVCSMIQILSDYPTPQASQYHRHHRLIRSDSRSH